MHWPRLFKVELAAQVLHLLGPVSQEAQFVPHLRHVSPLMYSSDLHTKQIDCPNFEPLGHVLHA